jgi:hypothetical protein
VEHLAAVKCALLCAHNSATACEDGGLLAAKEFGVCYCNGRAFALSRRAAELLGAVDHAVLHVHLGALVRKDGILFVIIY